MIPRFRAWDIKEKKMIHGCCNLLIGLDGLLWWQFADSINILDNQNNFILMLSAGHKDKNRTEYFEGDIVKLNNGLLAEIVWDEGIFGFGYKLYEPKPRGISLIPGLPVGKIIGNIHANPKLLEG